MSNSNVKIIPCEQRKKMQNHSFNDICVNWLFLWSTCVVNRSSFMQSTMTRFFGLIMVQKWKKRLFSVCWLAQVWFAVSCRRYYQHDHRTTRIVVLATLQFKYWRRRPSLVVAARWPKPSLRCKEKTKPIASKRNNCVLVSYVTHWGWLHSTFLLLRLYF